jgi:hypothetical protein
MQMQLFKNMGCYSSTHLTRISTPRFLGKKRGKGLQRSSTIFTSSPWSSFLKRLICCITTSWIHPLGSSFQLYWWKEGITLERYMFSTIEYLRANSWKECFINIFWADKQETPGSVRRNGKVSNLVRKVMSTFVLYSQTIKREALDVWYGYRKERLNSGLLSLKTWFLVSI